MKAMISQPMRGKVQSEIEATRLLAKQYLESKGYEVVDTLYMECLFADGDNGMDLALYGLAKALEAMSKCDTVYFCRDWQDYRGCKIEHDVAAAYGLEIIEEV